MFILCAIRQREGAWEVYCMVGADVLRLSWAIPPESCVCEILCANLRKFCGHGATPGLGLVSENLKIKWLLAGPTRG